MLASISLRLLLDPRLVASTRRDHFCDRAAAIRPAFGEEVNHRDRQRYAAFPDDFVFCFAFHFHTLKAIDNPDRRQANWIVSYDCSS